MKRQLKQRVQNLNQVRKILKSKPTQNASRSSYKFRVLDLPQLPSINEIIQLYGLTAKKELAQNFLLNEQITDRIAKVGGNLTKNAVIEVGPGPGSLTRSLLKLGASQVIGIEKDSRFLPSLHLLEEASQGKFKVIHADILTLDEAIIVKQIPSTLQIQLMGNLPFNISTELLIKWLKQLEKNEGPFIRGRNVPMTLLFQKEVAEVFFFFEIYSFFGWEFIF